MIELETVATGLQFPEGPIALADGSVLVVEIKRGTLTRISPEGELTVVAQCGGGPNGAAIGPDGAVYICNNGGFEWSVVDGFLLAHGTPADYSGRRIQRVDLETGDVEELYTECKGRALRGPNDLVFDADGGSISPTTARATAQTWTSGSSITQARRLVHHVRGERDARPNGVGLSPDGTKLYVSETTTGFVWWWDVKGPGALERRPDLRRQWRRELLLRGPNAIFDSLGVDAAGNVCIATLLKSGITVVSPGGELVDFTLRTSTTPARPTSAGAARTCPRRTSRRVARDAC